MIRARPGGLSGFDECSSAPGCLSHSPPWSSNPTSSYTLRGCFGGDLVFSGSSARKCFPQKSFVWGKGGVCHDFDSRPYKKCAHFAHFSETPCRVTRGLRTAAGTLARPRGRRRARCTARYGEAPQRHRRAGGRRPRRGGLPCTTTSG